MADLSVNIAGVKSPNPFWLASAPPTNSGAQIQRAFDLGWGGAVWKTLGDPIINVNSRFWSADLGSNRMMGLTNIELITDRPWEVNIVEIKDTKKKYPKHAIVVSLMVESKKEAWQQAIKELNDTGCDGVELNFGCPHGMSERGMGSAVGQVPQYTTMITEWVKEVAEVPVFVKLTPNVSDITAIGRAAAAGGADALSLINTVDSIMGINLDTFSPMPSVNGKGSHGGYSGPAIKPIGLKMVSVIARDPKIRLPISGIGGIATWQDAVEFMLVGATGIQVCTAVMHYGYRIVEDMIDGLNNWMDGRGFKKCTDFIGKALPNILDWGDLNLNYRIIARINSKLCIGCELCHVAAWDGSHQCIDLQLGNGNRVPVINEAECIGCNLCMLVCPVDGCVTMIEQPTGRPPVSWRQYQEALGKGTSCEPPGYLGH
ncbi:MAG TPA: NAD-dependent dihydropyrimidine dehydrogenase subunit PreA [Verrucomicrobiae bacterium]|nr:NAD-dependent dihydropyrimidine dehydrogenase subunit PreA [Verrucomicrobiae bacterium]